MSLKTLLLGLAGWLMATVPALAFDAFAVQQGGVVLTDSCFKTGETLKDLRLRYRTLGTPQCDAKGCITNAVLILHGTGGSGAQFLAPQFADELYGSGQPLDVSRYFIILPV